MKRLERGLSPHGLSRRAGLSPAYAGRMERLGVDPPLSCFARLVIALGMTPDEVWVIMCAEAQRPTTAADPVAVTPWSHNGDGD